MGRARHTARPARSRCTESCNSWYLGANVPGKTRTYMPYAGGLTTYMQHCREVVNAGYTGFDLA